jgi:hypothetical protein
MSDEQHNDSASLAENVHTARNMVAGGQKHEAVAHWLHAQMKGHAEELDSVAAASAAITGDDHDA